MKVIVFLLITLPAIAQTPEPQYINNFEALSGGALVPLERQTATITGKTKALGFGGAKASSEFKPAQSPVRFSANALPSFVVRWPAAGTAADPASMFVLRQLKAKSHSRELVITNVRMIPLVPGATKMTTNLAEGVIPIAFEPYGEHSLKVALQSPLPPGEYAFSGRLAAMDLFCFGVD